MKRFDLKHLMRLGVALPLSLWGMHAMAATNQATDPGGGGVTLSSSATITINPATLSIVKEARDLNGNVLGATVSMASGTQFYFVLYVDNTTDLDLSDVRLIDAVDTSGTGFTVDNTSFQILNTVGSPGIEMTAGNDTAWTAAGTGGGTWNGLTWNSLTAAVDADQLDWNVTVANRVTIGNVGGNGQLNIVKSTQANKTTDPRRVAFRFKVTLK